MNMDPGDINRLCDEVLSTLEIDEARLLNWGFVTGVQSLADLDAQLTERMGRLDRNSPELAALWARAQAAGLNAKMITDNLVRRRLIFKGSTGYRTRFAEVIRNLSLLRQRFSMDDWSTGERLVGDFRLFLQRRRYPRRETSPAELLADLRPLNQDRLTLEAIKALLEQQGAPLRLARFQVESIFRILENLGQPGESAVVIGAGTGAGKTKAFYVPALATIAAQISGVAAVQALALYPRIELLKDQLRETYAEARRLDALLAGCGKRPIVIGAYYGDVPRDAEELLSGRRDGWRRAPDRSGRICPWLPCPRCGSQTMVWLEEDLKREASENKRGVHGRFAMLNCISCGEVVDGTRLHLTRRQMKATPPDILFTTTEMLNRRLSHTGEHALFGIGAAPGPRLLLMDEIHLNEGIHGAQVAYLIRRWRGARRAVASAPLCIVGLSATVTQAEQFFARLTGVSLERVSYIAPAESELIKEGMEYNVALRGDAVSGVSLLSTSVRTAMLLCRSLDALTSGAKPGVSEGAIGQRVFAFSDKLDVINRWYHIEKEVENPVEPYSHFLWVDPQARDAQARYNAGQFWHFISQIHGGPMVLASGLRLDITSSQYTGIDDRANLVIASSTLEVGYNDPTVGAVLQHKAPHSRASFIQRKGRAGRTRGMRPWMLLITSAYGHDQWAFRNADAYFDPLLPPLDLPIENYYVRKIQAAWSLMDWLALQLKASIPEANLWELLSSHDRARSPALGAARRRAAETLSGLLSDDLQRDAFRRFLIDRLQLEDEAGFWADTLLWGEPRPLLLEVVPTALRQLETDWQRVAPETDGTWTVQTWDDSPADRPLVGFVPATLFSDLQSPDVTIEVPEKWVEPGAKVPVRSVEMLGLALALSEYVPGKVNKRFSRREKIREAHWLQLPEANHSENHLVEISALDMQVVPLTQPVQDNEAGKIFVYTPTNIRLRAVPRFVRPTSTAYFAWLSSFTPGSRSFATGDAGEPLPLRAGAPWRGLIREGKAFVQANNSWVTVTRGAYELDVYTRFEQGPERRERYRLAAGSEPAALGFSIDSDALHLVYAPLDAESLRLHPDWFALRAELAPHFFHAMLARDSRIRALKLSALEVDAVCQLVLAILLNASVESAQSLALSAEMVFSDLRGRALRILSTIQGHITEVPQAASRARATSEAPRASQRERRTNGAGEWKDDQGDGLGENGEPAAEDDSEAEDWDAELPENAGDAGITSSAVRARIEDRGQTTELGYLQEKLLAQISHPEIGAALRATLAALWDAEHPCLIDWLNEVYAFTLGSTLLAGLLALTPEVQSDDLHLDIDAGKRAIWISETAAGGVGLVAKLTDRLLQQPRQFDHYMLRAVRSCPRAELSNSLFAVADLIEARDPELRRTFADLRVAADLPRIEETRLALSHLLQRAGVPATRSLVRAVNMKFLQPNSAHDTDTLIAVLARFVREQESRTSCAFDVGVLAAAAALDPQIAEQARDVLLRMSPANTDLSPARVHALILSLLWVGCSCACPDCIERPQRYQDGAQLSRRLLHMLLVRSSATVDATAQGWREQAAESLRLHSQVELRLPSDHLPSLMPQVAALLTEVVDLEYQIHFPAIERIERRDGDWIVHMVLSEMAEV